MISIEQLKQFELFKSLSDDELENVGEIAKKEQLRSDTRIFEEKSIANKLYLICGGRVVIKLRAEMGKEQLPVDTVGPGEVFGWSAVAEPHSFTAAACTLEDSEFYVINSDTLLDLFRKNNHIGYKVMKELASVISSRFRQLSQKLVNSL